MTALAKDALRSFLHRERDGMFGLYFCRGPGRCPKSDRSYRQLKCSDCVRGRETETLQELLDRIDRADA